MANGQQFLGQALQGLGAGLQGNVPQFFAQQQQQRQQETQGDLERKKTLLTDSVAALNFARQGRFDLVSQLFSSRQQLLQQFPGAGANETNIVKGLADLAATGDQQAQERLIENLGNNVTIAEGLGLIKPEETKLLKASEVIGGQVIQQAPSGEFVAKSIQGFKPDRKARDKTSSKRDFDEFKRLEAIAKRSGDPEDAKNAEQFGRQSRFLRLSEERASDLKVSESERKAIAKATVARKQGFVDSGITAADSTAGIRRSLELLKDVETGGFDSVRLRASQLLGIEGADELELSTNMGIAVLSQLRPIFGAAFTAKEGEELTKISAGFGRSTKGNIRLMGRALKLADRAARRGLAAAIDLDDAFTAGEIRDSLTFKITPREKAATEQGGVAPQAAGGIQFLGFE